MTPKIAERVDQIKRRLVLRNMVSENVDILVCTTEDIQFMLDTFDKYQKLVEKADEAFAQLENPMTVRAIVQDGAIVTHGFRMSWLKDKKQSGLFEEKKE